MRSTFRCLIPALLTALAAAAPAHAEVTNLICRYEPVDGYKDMEVLWIDPAASKVTVVMSFQNRTGMHAKDGGGNIEDVKIRSKSRSAVETWPATITATTVAWTRTRDTTRPTKLDRQTNTLTWTTPEDPTPPNHGTAHCEKGDLPLPNPGAPMPLQKH